METLLISLLGLRKYKTFSKKEILILEVLFYIRICNGLKEHFVLAKTMDLQNYNIKEDLMIDGYLIRRLANDLILNEDYSMKGLAHYTGFPEEAIYDLVSGINYNPTIALSNKILELHVSARKEFYTSLVKDLITVAKRQLEIL